MECATRASRASRALDAGHFSNARQIFLTFRTRRHADTRSGRFFGSRMKAVSLNVTHAPQECLLSLLTLVIHKWRRARLLEAFATI
jgi:hypothetical protein